jgi:hypothetical protein
LVGSLALVVFGAGCDDSLSEDAVTSIPAGNASGAALTGEYQLEWTTLECSGICARLKVSDLESISVCDVGFRQRTTARITQTDGRLQLDVDDSLFAGRLSGGVNQDGAFDVGGIKTEAGQRLTLRSRATGTIDPASGAGEVRTYSTGRADLPEQRCESRHELRLTR